VGDHEHVAVTRRDLPELLDQVVLSVTDGAQAQEETRTRAG
jgi:hypothetical protein